MHGERLVCVCSEERLDALAKQYRPRQFVDAELRAGEILWTVAANPTDTSTLRS